MSAAGRHGTGRPATSATAGPLAIFAVTPPGLEEIVRRELTGLGASALEVAAGGVSFAGDARLLMRANLWSRCASRFLVRVGAFHAAHLAELRRKAAALSWSSYITPGSPLRVRAVCRRSRIYHSGAAVNCVLQAIGDALGYEPELVRGEDESESGPETPNRESPCSVPVPLVFVRIESNDVTVSLDTSGAHLHRRGYRQATAKAPLRENLAAACLQLAGWSQAEPLYDPMCGSGTLLIEAALLGSSIAPGSSRHYAFEAWPSHDADSWAALRAESDRATVRDRPLVIGGSDRDEGAIAACRANAERAGVAHLIQVERKSLSEARPNATRGLLLCNPPYGARIGDRRRLRDLYARLGQVSRTTFGGWRLAFLTSARELATATGVPLTSASPILNHGGIKVKLYASTAGV